MLLGFRDQYGEVYVTQIGEDDYVFRTITMKEHRDLAEFIESEDDAFEAICNLAILWPKIDFRRGPAYLPTMLAPLILEESGFGERNKQVEQVYIFREWMQSFEAQAPVIIATAFPQYKIEEIELWTREKLIKYATMAEWQFKQLRGMPLFSLIPVQVPNEEETEEEPKPQKSRREMINEHAAELRKRGFDPMLILQEQIKPEREPFVPNILIGGTRQVEGMIAGIDAWRGESIPYGRYDVVQEQIQKVSRRRL